MSAIRWINDRLGSGPGDRLAGEPNLEIVDVRDLVDRPGNTAGIVRAKLDQALQSLREGRKVVVCCDYGISRNNAVAAGVLALAEQLPLAEAVRQVMQATGEKSIKVEVLAVVRQALETYPGCGQRSASPAAGVLVTGATGVLGTALVRRLGAARRFCTPTRQEVELLRGAVDLDLYMQEHEIGCVVHLANPRIFYSTAALGETLCMLRNVLDACRQNRARLIYLSGWEVYSGYRSAGMLAAESLPMLPKGVYAETKYLCELLIQHHQQEYGLDCLILRSSPVYGPGSDKPKFLYHFLHKAREGRDIVTHEYRNGLPALDLLHLDDITSAIVRALDCTYSGSLNLGTGRCTSTAEVAAMICRALGSRSRILQTPIDAWVGNIAMDTSRAEAVLGWNPTISLEQGLLQLAEQWTRCRGPEAA